MHEDTFVRDVHEYAAANTLGHVKPRARESLFPYLHPFILQLTAKAGVDASLFVARPFLA